MFKKFEKINQLLLICIIIFNVILLVSAFVLSVELHTYIFFIMFAFMFIIIPFISINRRRIIFNISKEILSETDFKKLKNEMLSSADYFLNMCNIDFKEHQYFLELNKQAFSLSVSFIISFSIHGFILVLKTNI